MLRRGNVRYRSYAPHHLIVPIHSSTSASSFRRPALPHRSYAPYYLIVPTLQRGNVFLTLQRHHSRYDVRALELWENRIFAVYPIRARVPVRGTGDAGASGAAFPRWSVGTMAHLVPCLNYCSGVAILFRAGFSWSTFRLGTFSARGSVAFSGFIDKNFFE